MKKFLHLVIAVAAGLCTLGASASTHWTLQGKDYTVDTVFHAKIGPGTTQTSLSLSGGSNLKIFYTTTDLTDPYVDIRVAQAGSKLTGGAKLSAMSNANTNASAGIEYFAGVNADFFGNSQPIGASVVNGSVYKAPASSTWINWYMNDNKVPGIEQLQFGGTASAPDGSTYHVSAINDGRGTDALILFNDHYAATTGTNAYGTEVLVSCPDNISYNGKYTCTVEAAPVSGVGSMSIPTGRYILSGHGAAATFLNNLKVGDTVELDLNTELATGGTVTQMAGGQPVILRNGETLETQNALDHLTALNPRTAVGYSADRKTLVLLVVDGRGMGGSAGVVSKVLADIMRSVGCADAMNFDGGGSSELYTRSFGVRNRPSDGTERTVVNSVWAVSVAPADNEVAEIAFATPSISLPRFAYFTPTVYAYNKYGVMLSTDLKGFTLSCPDALGEITDNGTVLYAKGEGKHTLTATYNGATATMTVNIGTAQPRARLEKAILDGYRTYKTEIVADVEGTDMSVDNAAFEWSVDNPDILAVTADGTVSGLADGQANVTAKVEDFSATLPVTVEIPKKRYIGLINGDITDWSTDKSALSAATLSAEGTGFAIDGKISSQRNIFFSLKPANAITLYSLPDSVRLAVNPGAATITSVEASMSANGGASKTVTVNQTIDSNTTGIVNIAVSDLCDTDDLANFPVSLLKLTFNLKGSNGTEFHAQIPTLSAVYTSVTASDGIDAILPDGTYGNTSPVKEGSTAVKRGQLIELTSDSAWSVVSMTGATVLAGNTDTIDSALLSPGCYIVANASGASRIVVR